MRRRPCRRYCRKVDKKWIGLLILLLGIAIVAIITLPYKVWIVIIGCMMIYIGYKLFMS
ncbi:MAG TPA: hypothetical protein GX503_07955 [Clostridiales bacterium]|nr:hypothetical protein [Clostridiales bacterium]